MIQAIQAALAAFRPEQSRCPSCGAAHHLAYHSNYHRTLVEHNGGSIQDQEATISRYQCLSCGKTHAILPSPLIPYARYSLDFMRRTLLAYSLRDKLGLTVQGVAKKFGIAVSTLYEWKARAQKNLPLFLGAMRSQAASLAAFARFIGSWRGLARGLRLFFETYGFSFMQRKPLNSATGTNPQTHPSNQSGTASIKCVDISELMGIFNLSLVPKIACRRTFSARQDCLRG
jgi:hypothetical protein